MRRSDIILRNGLVAGAAATVVALAAWLSATPASAASGPCPDNEAVRAEQSSTYLPNCRAYEQVSPVEKDSGEPYAVAHTHGQGAGEEFLPVRGALAAFDGERMAWLSEDPGLSSSEAESLGMDYLSTRTAVGWKTEATVPPQSLETGLACAEEPGIVGWSRNFSKGILADGATQDFGNATTLAFDHSGGGCGHAEPALKEADGAQIEEPPGFQNLFLRDSGTGFYQLVNVTPADAPTPTPKEAHQPYMRADFLAGSERLEHVAFEDELPLTEAAEKLSPAVEAACEEEPKGRECWEGHDDLYVWSEGRQPAVRLVSLLPGGEPAEGVLAGSTRNGILKTLDRPTNIADYRHTVSRDGSRIFFEAEGNLYVRENAGEPQSAIASGSSAVNGEQCTEPAKACTIQLDLPTEGAAGPGGGGRWLGANADGTKVLFTDEASAGLTTTTQPASGVNLYEYELPSGADTPGSVVDLTPDVSAEVLGMSGVSEDGSEVYFVADGALPGSGENSEGATAQAGQPNLYLSHEGALEFIATLNEGDFCDWTSNTGCKATEPNNTKQSGLTARMSANGRYLAFNSVNQLTVYENVGPACAPVYEGGVIREYVAGSCDEIYLYEAEGSRLVCASCNPNGAPSGHGGVIDYPTLPMAGTDTYPQRNVSEAGQVFFETSEALLPAQDKNGVRDVYEYEGGTLHLISSGTSTAPSYFLGAGAAGRNVFFATAQKLERWDTDSVYDIYDAREGGGFPEPPAPAEPCASERCKPAAGAAALFAAPSSVTFAGPGNVQQPAALNGGGKESTKSKHLTRRQKLRRALRHCRRIHKHNRHKRVGCKRYARKRYGVKAKGATRHHGDRARRASRGGRR